MRKIVSLLAALFTCLVPLFAPAEGLPTPFSQTVRWNQTYEAHGREIYVDLEVGVPDTLEADILTARVGNSSLSEEQLARYAAMEKTFKFGANNSEGFLGMGVNNPFIALPGQKSGQCRTWMLDLATSDVNTAYAENSPVTLGQAWDTFCSEVAYCYGEDVARQLVVTEVEMNDRLKVYNKKKQEYGQPLREYGSYQFTALQSFHGLPLLCHVRTAFDPMVNGEHFRLLTGLIGVIANEEAFHFRFSLMEEEDVVAEKVPLCSAQDAVAVLEAEIEKGRIRNVHSLQLAYILWNDAKDEELFYMIPCWVAECDYFSSAKKKESKEDQQAEHYTDKTCYQKIMVNALTGKLVEPEDKSKHRSEAQSDWFQ